jgi:hypothetical protein
MGVDNFWLDKRRHEAFEFGRGVSFYDLTALLPGLAQDEFAFKYLAVKEMAVFWRTIIS